MGRVFYLYPEWYLLKFFSKDKIELFLHTLCHTHFSEWSISKIWRGPDSVENGSRKLCLSITFFEKGFLSVFDYLKAGRNVPFKLCFNCRYVNGIAFHRCTRSATRCDTNSKLRKWNLFLIDLYLTFLWRGSFNCTLDYNSYLVYVRRCIKFHSSLRVLFVWIRFKHFAKRTFFFLRLFLKV